VTDTQIVRLLNIAQRKLCSKSRLMRTCHTASTVADQQEYSVPTDFFSVEGVRWTDTTGAKMWLTPIKIRQLSDESGDPCKYAEWGLNVSGANSPAIWLDPIPDASGSSDLEIFIKAMPLTMVSGGQAPEVPVAWQDSLIPYACWKVYQRRGREWVQMAMAAKQEWMEWLREAERWSATIQTDVPHRTNDTAGYLASWE
jgi:hypothetical protein